MSPPDTISADDAEISFLKARFRNYICRAGITGDLANPLFDRIIKQTTRPNPAKVAN